ncbi:CLC4F protein, partial [Amia calva]|nr:CLC4F protein [Amia calva]
MTDEVIYTTVKFAPQPKAAEKELGTPPRGVKAAPTPELKGNGTAPPYKWLTVVLTILVLSVIMALGVCCKYYAEKRGDYEILKARFDNLSFHMNATENQNWELNTKYTNLSDAYNALVKSPPENKGCKVCSVGWVYNNGSCYFFSTDAMNWTNSRDDCVRKGGHLVIIESKEEQTFLANYLRKTQDKKYWIGLTDVVTEGVWLWMDNTLLTNSYWLQRTGQPSEPDNWMVEDPSGENCVCLEWSWYDSSCKSVHKGICETRAVSTT